LSAFPLVRLGHYPTPLEHLPRLSAHLAEHQIYVKRDDCTGLGLGGNKVRQLEFYLGDAISKGCDTVLSTGAIQSNYMRTLAAAASKLGLECHIQLEDRVATKSPQYHSSGNRLLTEMFGASITFFPEGEDEEAADAEINRIAERLESEGRKPYVVPLKPVKQPKGALGYVEAAKELIVQMADQELQPDLIVVPSGSGLTHSGLLFGLRLLGNKTPVLGTCVRRSSDLQTPRIFSHCQNLGRMIDRDDVVSEQDVWTNDRALAPGYGEISDILSDAIYQSATLEGLLLDPVYSGKSMACLLQLIKDGKLKDYKNIVVIHTGGAPAIFAYQEAIQNLSELKR
jgi:D-cysteine desulfhydrase family pyridoxal phosphate-dependent enzyme